MLGWSIKASACRSASNRASTVRESMPILISFSATMPAHRGRLLGEVDRAHPPLAEDFEQLVAAGDHLPRHESAGSVGPRGARDRGVRAVRALLPGRRFRRRKRFRIDSGGRFQGCG